MVRCRDASGSTSAARHGEPMGTISKALKPNRCRFRQLDALAINQRSKPKALKHFPYCERTRRSRHRHKMILVMTPDTSFSRSGLSWLTICQDASVHGDDYAETSTAQHVKSHENAVIEYA